MLIHKSVQIMHLEPFFIWLSSNIKWAQKFIPLSKSYKEGTIRSVRRNTAEFKLDISDYMQWHIWAGLEDLSWQLAKKYVKPESVVFDVGANVGAFSMKLASHVKGVSIHAFEPNPSIFRIFENNRVLNPKVKSRIIPNMLGLGEKQESMGFVWGASNSGGGKFTKDASQQKLEVTTLDKYVFENKLKQIDFLKIDVEGFEPMVIEGAKETIEKEKPVVYIEVSPVWWKGRGYKIEDVLGIFKTLGYTFMLEENDIQLVPVKWEAVIGLEVQHNLLILPPKI